MSFTEFLPRPEMLHVELLHAATSPLDLSVARLIAAELGEPALRTNGYAAWYGDAIVHNDRRIETVTVPFALRIDMKGNATIQNRWTQSDMLADAIVDLVPSLRAEILPYRAA